MGTARFGQSRNQNSGPWSRSLRSLEWTGSGGGLGTAEAYNATHADNEVVPVNHGGVSRATIAAQLGHSEASNRKFYAGTELPIMVTVPYRLLHADDPF